LWGSFPLYRLINKLFDLQGLLRPEYRHVESLLSFCDPFEFFQKPPITLLRIPYPLATLTLRHLRGGCRMLGCALIFSDSGWARVLIQCMIGQEANEHVVCRSKWRSSLSIELRNLPHISSYTIRHLTKAGMLLFGECCGLKLHFQILRRLLSCACCPTLGTRSSSAHFPFHGKWDLYSLTHSFAQTLLNIHPPGLRNYVPQGNATDWIVERPMHERPRLPPRKL